MNSSPELDTKPLLKVTELSKNYGQFRAVDSISFEVFPGEIVGVLGPNGAGKTTTLECILNLRTPDSGHIEVDGMAMETSPIKCKQLLGAQLQSTRLIDAITPLQALELAGGFYPDSATSAELLERFDLKEKARSAFHTLSAGQQQKLSLALALVHKPKLLILDEPTAGLDPFVRNSLQQTLLELRSKGHAILLSTHLTEEAEKLCDRILFIDHGELIAQGTAAEIISQSSQMSSIAIQLEHSATSFDYGSIPGVSSYNLKGNILTVETETPDAVLLALLEHLLHHNVAVEKLKIQKPNLESAYLALTGQAWPGSPRTLE